MSETTVSRVVDQINVSDPRIAKTAIEDIRAMPRATHPAAHGSLWRRIARCDILAGSRPLVTRACHTIPWRRTIRAGMVEEIVARHIFAVPQRGIVQRRVHRQRQAANPRTLLIHQFDHAARVGVNG